MQGYLPFELLQGMKIPATELNGKATTLVWRSQVTYSALRSPAPGQHGQGVESSLVVPLLVILVIAVAVVEVSHPLNGAVEVMGVYGGCEQAVGSVRLR